MAFFTSARPVADGVFGNSLGFSVADLFARVAAWNDKNVTRRELAKLSDRELDDIGLCRGDIEDVLNAIR